MKLAVMAARIYAHLRRMENDLAINKVTRESGIHSFFCVNSWAGGRYVYVRYVSFQGESALTKKQALRYLAWLDAGNNKKHFAMPTEEKS